jgi:hypothetical protein
MELAMEIKSALVLEANVEKVLLSSPIVGLH